MSSTPLRVNDPLERWRLLLGEAAQDACGGLSESAGAADAALDWLYGRDSDLGARGERTGAPRDKSREGNRFGVRTDDAVSVPDWINAIHQLFPQEVIERLEQDAVERYGIDEIVTNAEVLQRIEPSPSLLRAVLQTKHLMNPEVLAMARQLVGEVVRRIMEQLQTQVRQAFSGTRDRRKPSRRAVAANFDFKRTVASNLHRYDPNSKRLYLQTPRFNSRSKKHTDTWDIILLVDQSGSMTDSVIHSAVLAACLWGLPGMRTHLIAYDTEVVDLTQDAADPVALLMKVQLGGGNDGAKAIAYAQGLVRNPAQTVLVVISDFYEEHFIAQEMVRRMKQLIGDGAKVLGLMALDAQAVPSYDHEVVQAMANAGAKMGAMTPGHLAAWLAEQLHA